MQTSAAPPSAVQRSRDCRVAVRLQRNLSAASQQLRISAEKKAPTTRPTLEGGATERQESLVEVERTVRRLRDRCFDFDSRVDPSHHALQRQATFLTMPREQRSLLASGAPRVVTPTDASCCIADNRGAWTPFATLREEVEHVIPPVSLRLPRDPPQGWFSQRRALMPHEVPRSLQRRPQSALPNPRSAAVDGPRESLGPNRRQEVRTVGFVKIPVQSSGPTCWVEFV